MTIFRSVTSRTIFFTSYVAAIEPKMDNILPKSKQIEKLVYKIAIAEVIAQLSEIRIRPLTRLSAVRFGLHFQPKCSLFHDEAMT